MAFLYKHLRVNQVFGANTDAGKTLITAALCRADSLKSRDKQVFYLKPVSTGPLKDADDQYAKFEPSSWYSRTNISPTTWTALSIAMEGLIKVPSGLTVCIDMMSQ
jgi:dethiobiotin synthetase